MASPTIWPSRRTLATGSSVGCRVSSLVILKISRRGCPVASSGDHPVREPATGLAKVSTTRVSVAITASPMLVNTAAARDGFPRPGGGNMKRSARRLIDPPP